jgi:hypothetical protein
MTSIDFDVLLSMHTRVGIGPTRSWHPHPHILLGAVDEIILVDVKCMLEMLLDWLCSLVSLLAGVL